MGLNLAVLPGDGVGSAATTQELNVSQMAGEKLGYRFDSDQDLLGGIAIDELGEALSYETLDLVVGYAGVGLERRIMSGMLGPNWEANALRSNLRGG
jgi:isocitrate/isopropylmalate dehydrogenase